jgi:hypothetical protein
MTRNAIATWSSCAIWILGFLLALVIPPSSKLIWIPDTLLLVGFFPVLFVWQPGWPWLIFGIGNMFIGFVLQVAFFLPDTGLPQTMVPVRAHLAQYHVPMIWILTGIGSTIYGIIRMVKHLTLWLKQKARKGKSPEGS